ncbi:MAG: hypothetical protein ABTQ34_04530 [Bdellovibrionales bacterium]
MRHPPEPVLAEAGTGVTPGLMDDICRNPVMPAQAGIRATPINYEALIKEAL